MARLKVTPTRMNLNTLKERLATSKRGYKLLKDKQDELMRQFLELIRKNKKLREEVEKELEDSFSDFLIASAFMSPEFMEEAVSFPTQKLGVDISIKNVMSVRIPKMEFKVEENENASMFPYGYAETSAGLDKALKGLNEVMNRLLELAELEKTTQLMADEIESTRRRVNALEYRTIPDLEETIKYIRSKLEENERATISRLMKVKDIIAEQK
ncbi:V-type sodium pump subunit D [Anaerococcus prevotii]|uniref:V-type ATP synthase subunit D n=1 Tax=Anaerococcus prevotii (strain ATCC 9321 / DSM 20548 / JCM 6508 / NCTC 11806 / PC1) TaxID=525919 RepID=C7REU1_ANAPD|nr:MULTISPECIES: V-type ATP synthase subunit D [Anaerococcus]ACV29704.1 V-type ATPase, D subunit [Anaerococcus prevotii DSM 20548]MDU2557695.1 V-type ATP synthase subunit D [Anaerococcus prevotii]MDU2584758.1 V-type ATP synthase subunit D [Anaerococcus prevotii]MDU3136082.1 V-type ATP synthase subunit D [Anaerococcus prevotii]SUU95377.1 V-type sodium pump subunit D [Anaerococcus prevotii]